MQFSAGRIPDKRAPKTRLAHCICHRNCAKHDSLLSRVLTRKPGMFLSSGGETVACRLHTNWVIFIGTFGFSAPRVQAYPGFVHGENPCTMSSSTSPRCRKTVRTDAIISGQMLKMGTCQCSLDSPNLGGWQQ